MSELQNSETAGWPVLHLFFRIDRAHWHSFDEEEREAAVLELVEWLQRVSRENGVQLVPIAGIAKFDVAFLIVHPDLRRIQELGQELAGTGFGTCIHLVYSFLSLSDASEYMTTPGDWARQLIDEKKMDPATEEFAASVKSFAKRMETYAEARIHPVLPTDLPVVCFYPMAKARGEKNNWYALDFEARKKLMLGHGEKGREFAGRVLQLVTSCAGLDDWEWGVTLFARDLKSIRDVVYEMRFDPASALYGLFGEFYVGLRFAPDELADVLRL